MKKALILILIVVLVVCAVEAAILARTPLTYLKAERSFKNGEYEQARGMYVAIRFKDSVEKALECNYRLAEERFDRGDYIAAWTLYDGLIGYKEAGQKALTCEYLTAAETRQDREAAEQILHTYDGELSVVNLRTQYDYILACLAFERNEIDEALLAFQQLGEYADSREWVDRCRVYIYDSAMASMLERDFASAVLKFAQVEPYGKSELYGKYCALRLEKDDVFAGRTILTNIADMTELNFSIELNEGKIYYYEPVYIYVPNKIDTDTKFLIYFAGGDGLESFLDTWSAFSYCGKYSPNAICVMRINSGIPEAEAASREMIALVEHLAAECGLVVREPTLVGTSNGAYVAMRTAVKLYLEDYVEVKNLLTLDTGYDWGLTEFLLSKEEMKLTAAIGLQYYLFEQNGTAPYIDAIWDLVYSGNNVTAVYGHSNDHDEITSDAFGDGLFSWLLGEKDQLDERYVLVPMEP